MVPGRGNVTIKLRMKDADGSFLPGEIETKVSSVSKNMELLFFFSFMLVFCILQSRVHTMVMRQYVIDVNLLLVPSEGYVLFQGGKSSELPGC